MRIISVDDNSNDVFHELVTVVNPYEYSFTAPSGTTGFIITVEYTGYTKWYLVAPDLSEHFLFQESTQPSSTSLYEKVRELKLSDYYSGAGTDWKLKAERYSDTSTTNTVEARILGVVFAEFGGVDLSAVDYGLISDLILNCVDPYYPEGEYFDLPSSAGDGGEVEPPPPTFTAIVAGNVKKLDSPFEAIIVAVSVDLVNPEVLGTTKSDPVTGDYSLDVAPHIDEVLLYVAPDYGSPFVAGFGAAKDQLFHPTVPNKNVYRALNDGSFGDTEPQWVDSGTMWSGTVELKPEPLYRPLMNGFVKPTVQPIP